jgi:two-component system NtrC family sensor kinase
MEERATDPAVAERGAKIKAAAERCSRIVKLFLAMARQRPPEHRRFHLNDVAAGAVDLVAYGLRSAGIEVDLDFAAALPALQGDADQIGQVLANLLVNAEQALQEVPQPRRLAIRTDYDEAAGMVRLSVADNGKGVPEAVRSRIFDPFFTTKPVGTGTGLGLSLCQSIVLSHGGTLSLEDTPGGGATFVVALPVAETEPGEHAPVTAVFASSVPRRALIVDDEPDLAELLAEVLAQQGVDSDIVPNGAAAVERLRDRDYDVVLSDLRMPDLDGPGLFEWIRAERAELLERTVFVTGDRLGPSATAFLQSCGRPYLEKPFLPEEVWRAVGAVLENTAAP